MFSIILRDPSRRQYFRSETMLADEAEAVHLAKRLLKRPGYAEVWADRVLLKTVTSQ